MGICHVDKMWSWMDIKDYILCLFFFVAIYTLSKFITVGHRRTPGRKGEAAGELNPCNEKEGQLMRKKTHRRKKSS